MCKGVIYSATIKDAKKLVAYLERRRFKKVFLYHSELSVAERKSNLEAFIKSGVGIMIATTSFGEGLDYDFIRFVLCYHVPSNTCELVQMFGRAGREGDPSFCGVLVDPCGIAIRRGLINKSSSSESEAHRKFLLSEFNRLLGVLRGDTCLRSSMLDSFGEDPTKLSPCCSICDPVC